MKIPATVKAFLKRRNVDYSVLNHAHAESSMRAAQSAHVSGDRIAKGVLLKDQEGYVLALLPASYNVKVGELQELLGRPVELAPEMDLGVVFPDCALGAVPALGAAYEVPVVVDAALLSQPEIYFEAGNHEALVRVDEPEFEALLGDAPRLNFHVHKA